MKPETRDRLIASMNRIAAEGTDGKDLYTSVSELSTVLSNLPRILANFESPERMSDDLDKMEEPSPHVLAMIEGTVRHAPTLIYGWVRIRAALGLKFLPNPAMGRPIAVPYEQRRAVCDELSRITRKGHSLEAASKKVAKEYRVDARTIRRIWEMRSDYDDPSSEVTLDQAQDFVQNIIKDAISNPPSRH